ncbi:hypothetical protein CKG00_10820 [Morganella morganii]|uniref:Uncharacterized protein n=1 Tax=Morganella morganii TaxID=582 RepID=A0A433ZXI2_MORMO|nr:hypothetical protein [Morganella morganii]RUT66823.1 hypothetical protein CKG00_10820 [Morganella morganii]
MSTSELTPNHLGSRIACFSDSRHLAEELERIAFTLKSNDEHQDAYYLDESADHIIGLYRELIEYAAEIVRLKFLLGITSIGTDAED